ncbi:hypothetical protein [Rubrivirga sp.]|uniref:hypothetical protein n=1 Tax=Rubrivirga sp. TaxID=1885344 RepID=UPI003B52165E
MVTHEIETLRVLVGLEEPSGPDPIRGARRVPHSFGYDLNIVFAHQLDFVEVTPSVGPSGVIDVKPEAPVALNPVAGDDDDVPRETEVEGQPRVEDDRVVDAKRLYDIAKSSIYLGLTGSHIVPARQQLAAERARDEIPPLPAWLDLLQPLHEHVTGRIGPPAPRIEEVSSVLVIDDVVALVLPADGHVVVIDHGRAGPATPLLRLPLCDDTGTIALRQRVDFKQAAFHSSTSVDQRARG